LTAATKSASSGTCKPICNLHRLRVGHDHVRSETDRHEGPQPLEALDRAVATAVDRPEEPETRRDLLAECLDVLLSHREAMALLLHDASVHADEEAVMIRITDITDITDRAYGCSPARTPRRGSRSEPPKPSRRSPPPWPARRHPRGHAAHRAVPGASAGANRLASPTAYHEICCHPSRVIGDMQIRRLLAADPEGLRSLQSDRRLVT